MSPSKILFFLCISFVLGIFLESVIKIPQIFIWGFLFVNFIAIIIFLFIKKDIFVIVGFCLLFLIMGVARVQISEFNIVNDGLSKLNGKGQVALAGVISDDSDMRDTSQKIKVKVGSSTILVTTGIYPEFKYLDTIKITGKLQTPGVVDGFNYTNYLLPQHIYSVMSFPKIETVGKTKANFYENIYSGILFLKQKMRQSIQNNFLPPESQILQSTILGDKGAVNQALKNKLSVTGLSHFMAIDGLHIVILISIIMAFLLAIGMWRSRAFYVAIIFICLYIILTGLSAAALRAGIMGGTYLLAQKLGRQALSSRMVVLAAALMLLANPLLLLYDVGFQLSFFAVFGLIYFEPLVRNFLKFLVKIFFNIKVSEKFENVFMLFSVTIAAQIFTLPIVIFNFGNISWVSPITNVLIMPIFYYIMLFGFLSSLIGIFWSFLGWLLSVPCYFLLLYFNWVLNFFSQPWMSKTITNVPWVWLLISYLIIGFATWFLNKKYSKIF